MPTRRNLTSAVPLLILAAALIVSNIRLLLGDSFYWGLPSLQFVPWREFAFSLLRAGELPLWNPYNGGGAPLFANYQSALLYPLNWPGFILPLAWSMSVTAVLHLFIAGWGMARLSGALGATAFGRGVAAIAFGMTQYLVARLGTYPMIAAAAWLPWELWAVSLIASGERRGAAWLALFAALQLLAGHAQTTWYSLLLCGLWGIFLLVRLDMPMRQRWLRLASMAAGVAVAVGAASLQLLATAELLANSQRESGVSFEFAMNFSYAPLRLLNLIAPNLFGTPADGSYFTTGAYFEDAVYIGLIPLMAAVAAVLQWLSLERRSAAAKLADPDTTPALGLRAVPFWFVIVVIAIVFAFGYYTPLFPFLYEHVPTFNLFQAPVRWHLWTACGLSILAGVGAGRWGAAGVRNPSLRRWAGRGLVVALAVLGVVLARGLLPIGETGRILVVGAAQPALVLAAACLITLRQPPRLQGGHSRWGMLLLGVAAADLVWAGWGLNPTTPSRFFDASANTQPAVRGYWSREDEEEAKFSHYFRFSDYRPARDDEVDSLRQAQLPNLNLLDRVPLFNNFDPLLPALYVRFVTLLEESDSMPLYQAAGIDSFRSDDGIFSAWMPGQFAWIVAGVCWHEQESDLIDALRDPAWQPSQLAHLLGDAGCPVENDAPAGRVVLSARDASQQWYQLDMARDSWLITADVEYPGWRAALDGVPVPIYRANLAFRAVHVPAGTHEIVFSYQPTWLVPGAVVSIASLCALVLLFGASMSSKRATEQKNRPTR